MKDSKFILPYESPLGRLILASDGEHLTGLWIEGQKYFGSTLQDDVCQKELEIFKETSQWLDKYFTGERSDVTPKLKVSGSAFRQRVWEILRTVPYGETTTYGSIARQMEQENGKRVSAQAVGGAIGHNPLMLVIPCHRVIGSDGSMTGYAGGIDKKIWLLNHEKNLW